MPITKSAKKRVRQEKIRNARNKIVSLKFKANIKELLEYIAKKKKTKSQELFKICEKQLKIAGNRGILKKKKISRKISSLNSKIKAI
jgi:ribosomal protein S20